MSKKIETKLTAARTRLILDKPFLGALVLRLPMKEADPEWCKTTATDAKCFYYNRDYIQALSLEETQFILAHEALHCGLSHFARRQHRQKNRWDVACDYAINPLLMRDGLKAPPGALHLPSYEGMTAEEIYPLIDENTEDGPMDQHLYDDTSSEGSQNSEQPKNNKHDHGDPPPPESPSKPNTENEGDGSSGKDDRPGPENDSAGAAKPPPLTPGETETLNVQWQQRLAGAAQQALQTGRMGESMARLVDHLLQPQLPWRMLLSRYLSQVARDDYSFSRPNNRREGEAILPSLRSSQVDVAVVLDTSGSIKDNEMREFISEVDALKGQIRARITLHACDDKLAADGPWVYEPWEEITLPESLEGGGGTSFVPAVEWANKLDNPPDVVVYFTDAEGTFPETEPNYPVIWLVKGKTQVPWGQRIQLN